MYWIIILILILFIAMNWIEIRKWYLARVCKQKLLQTGIIGKRQLNGIIKLIRESTGLSFAEAILKISTAIYKSANKHQCKNDAKYDVIFEITQQGKVGGKSECNINVKFKEKNE